MTESQDEARGELGAAILALTQQNRGKGSAQQVAVAFSISVGEANAAIGRLCDQRRLIQNFGLVAENRGHTTYSLPHE